MLTFNGILGKNLSLYIDHFVHNYRSQKSQVPFHQDFFKNVFFFTYGHQLVNDIKKYWSMGYGNIMFPSKKNLNFVLQL